MKDFREFVRIGSEYMARTRPDLWTVDQARATLLNWMHQIQINEGSGVGSGGFMLWWSDEEESYLLTMNIVDGLSTLGEEVFDWTTCHAH